MHSHTVQQRYGVAERVYRLGRTERGREGRVRAIVERAVSRSESRNVLCNRRICIKKKNDQCTVVSLFISVSIFSTFVALSKMSKHSLSLSHYHHHCLRHHCFHCHHPHPHHNPPPLRRRLFGFSSLLTMLFVFCWFSRRRRRRRIRSTLIRHRRTSKAYLRYRFFFE
jgi:hypothetical protein